jgi:EmrB/QacA subfamily drug resistance transporter
MDRDRVTGEPPVLVAPATPGGGGGGRGGSASGQARPLPGDEVPALEHWGLPLLAMVVGAFMSLLDSSIVNVAIPTMEHVFSVNTATVEWVVTIYLLALGVVVPASGWLGDRMGFKQLYLWSLAFFTVGSGLAAISPSLGLLIAARVIQALGGGMIMPTTMAMVYRIIPRRQLGVATAYFGMALLLAPAVGPTLGGYLVEYVNWRWIFTVNLPIGVFGGLLAAATIPEFPRHPTGRFDLAGFLAASIGLFTLLFALTEGATWGWTSQPITWLFYVSGVALLAFVWIELSVAAPLLDLKAFAYGQYTLSILFMVGINVALFSAVFFIPVYLQLVRGMGALATGLILMPGALVTGLFMPIAGKLYDRIGPRVPVVLGTLVLAGSTYLFRHLNLTTPDTTIAFWSALRGVGMGLAMMPAQNAGMAVIPPQMIGRASAIQNIVQRVAGSFGIAVLTVLLDNGQATNAALASAAYQPGSVAAASLQGAIAALQQTGIAVTTAAQEAYQQILGYLDAAAFTRSLDSLFVALAAIAMLTAIPAIFMHNVDLRRGAHRPEGMRMMME